MNDAALMGVMYRIADLDHQSQTIAGFEMLLAGKGRQRFAADKLHRDELLLAVSEIRAAGLEDLRNPRMLETREQLGFVLESPSCRGAGHRDADQLQRHRSSRTLLLGEIHHA